MISITSISVCAQGERNPHGLPLPGLWKKLTSAIEEKDTSHLNKIFVITSSILTHGCPENNLYVDDIKRFVLENKNDSAQILFIKLLITSINVDAIILSQMVDENLKAFRVKALFAELLSVKFLAIKYTFQLYQYTVNQLKFLKGLQASKQSNQIPEIVLNSLLFSKTCLYE